jgi:hypothetical protein
VGGTLDPHGCRQIVGLGYIIFASDSCRPANKPISR